MTHPSEQILSVVHCKDLKITRGLTVGYQILNIISMAAFFLSTFFTCASDDQSQGTCVYISDSQGMEAEIDSMVSTRALSVSKQFKTKTCNMKLTMPRPLRSVKPEAS